MQVKSPAYLYSEKELQKMREGVHFAPISKKYKHMIRNMIKLLALHDIYTTEDMGNYINKRRKTKAAREKPRWERTGRLRHTPPRTGPQYRNHRADHIWAEHINQSEQNVDADQVRLWTRLHAEQAQQQSYQPGMSFSDYRRLYN